MRSSRLPPLRGSPIDHGNSNAEAGPSSQPGGFLFGPYSFEARVSSQEVFPEPVDRVIIKDAVQHVLSDRGEIDTSKPLSDYPPPGEWTHLPPILPRDFLSSMPPRIATTVPLVPLEGLPHQVTDGDVYHEWPWGRPSPPPGRLAHLAPSLPWQGPAAMSVDSGSFSIPTLSPKRDYGPAALLTTPTPDINSPWPMANSPWPSPPSEFSFPTSPVDSLTGTSPLRGPSPVSFPSTPPQTHSPNYTTTADPALVDPRTSRKRKHSLENPTRGDPRPDSRARSSRALAAANSMSAKDSFIESFEMALKHICSSSSCGQAFDIWTQLKPIYSYSGLLRVATQVVDIFLLIALDRAASKALCRLVGPHAQVILDTLQMILDTGHTLSNEDSCRKHLQIRYLLLGLAKRSCQYPKCLVLSAITREGDHAVTAGHFGEIWKGRFQGDSVCVKVVKVYARSDVDKLLKAFTREAILWSHLSHENVLPFYGIHRLDDIAGRMCLISPWMENGNIGEYLLRNPKAKRLVLASDVCSGLAYLHAQDIVHGDLKGANILVTRTERACVADFGLSIIAENEIMRWTSTASAATLGGTVRWQAPELFNPEAEDTKSSKMSDVYALGCVFYEIFTGKVPFYEVPREATVISYILLGRAPTKPAPGSEPFSQWGLSDAIWTTCIERCWERLPEDRPRPSDILESSAFNEGSSSLAESAITGDFLQEGWMTPAEVRNSVRRREFGFGWSFLPPLNPPQMRPSIGEENTRKAKKIRLNKEGEDKIQPLHARSHLEYLEAVKNVFQDQPEVYSEFLDIMKNFKGGVPDVLSVVRRVATLFRDNHELIQKFKVFLPIGTQLDVSTDAHYQSITITTPTGVDRFSVYRHLVPG